ncbi:MAG TPA: methyltransferase domain-containing protein [Pyrinomonadaceae bacterium]
MYRDFGWVTPCPANGESDARLADSLVALVRQLGDVRRICDLGCGNGYLSGRLAKLDYEVTGIDASLSGIELGRSHHPTVNFVCANVNADLAGALSAGEFDLIISSDVIEHLYRPSDLLEAATALLRPRGHLLVCTPYHGYLKNLALSVTGRMDTHFTALWDGGHIKFFSVRTLSELIARHGFTNLSFSYYGRAPYLWKNMICHARKGDG